MSLARVLLPVLPLLLSPSLAAADPSARLLDLSDATSRLADAPQDRSAGYVMEALGLGLMTVSAAGTVAGVYVVASTAVALGATYGFWTALATPLVLLLAAMLNPAACSLLLVSLIGIPVSGMLGAWAWTSGHRILNPRVAPLSSAPVHDAAPPLGL
jgi:hypothetical protein